MLRFFILRVVLPVLLFLLVRAIVKSLFRASSVPQQARREAPEARPAGELKKDPVCGTYVSADTALTRTVRGQLLHFCSPACRDKYAA
jgi:YHS domain-containing protein